MRKLTLTLALVALLGASAFASEFYSSARGNGLGFSYMLLGNDPSANMYNPSALGYNRGWQAQGVYSLLNDYEYTGLNESPYYGHFGVSLYRPNMGTFSLNSLQSGSFAENTSITTLNTVAFSYGRDFAQYWAGGLSLKYFKETNYGERSAFDADLGFSYRSPVGFIAAVSGENLLQSKLKATPAPESQLPRRERFGAGYVYDGAAFQGSILAAGQMEQWGFATDVNTMLFNFGSEWWLLTDKAFSIGLRAGYTVGQALRNDTKVDFAEPSGGLSFNYHFGFNDLRFDYAINTYPYETTDNSTPMNHSVALTFGWGGLMQSFSQKHESNSQPEVQITRKVAPPTPVQDKQVVTPPAQANQNAVTPPPAPVQAQPNAPAPPPTTVAVQPQVVPEAAIQKQPDQPVSYQPFNVAMDVNDLSTPDFKRVIFYLRPQQVLKTAGWKLYIFKAKIDNFNDEEANRWCVAVIAGKGVPPINVVWDCLGKDQKLVKSGKYYFVLTAQDFNGQRYSTDWQKFSVD